MPAAEARAPIDLLADAARLADADAAAAHSLLDRVDVIGGRRDRLVAVPDPGALLGRKLGIEPRATVVSTVGGNSPQLLCNELAARIQRGELDVVR